MTKFTSMSHHCPGVPDLYWVPSHHLPPPGAHQEGTSPKWMEAILVWRLPPRIPSWMVQAKGSLQAKASSQLLKVGCLKSCFCLSCW